MRPGGYLDRTYLLEIDDSLFQTRMRKIHRPAQNRDHRIVSIERQSQALAADQTCRAYNNRRRGHRDSVSSKQSPQ